MEGKINKDGNLEIVKGGKMKPQFCPFMNGRCGDCCPHFRDPESGDLNFGGPPPPVKDSKIVRIRICHDTILHFDKLEDERVRKSS